MANYQLLKADIDAKVYENAHREITGEKLNSVLNTMVTTLGAEYQFAGVATIDTNPGTPDAKVFYIAKGKGTYTNFGSLEVTEDEVVILYYDITWHKVATGIASIDKLTDLAKKVDGKQDTLIAGQGISINQDTKTISCTLDTTIFKVVDSLPTAPASGDENKIHLVLSSSSEEGNTYDEYIWVNNSWERIGSFRPSVDLSGYAEKSYVDSQIKAEAASRTKADAELQTQINGKQEALTLTVKDNGNIVIANIQGQSKEFMPATPSGDPMHYAYVTAGAEYNDTGADIVKTAPWADLVDDDYTGEYGKTVVHKAGYWYLNGVGDITNDEIREIYQVSSNIVISDFQELSFCSPYIPLKTMFPINATSVAWVGSTRILTNQAFFNMKKGVVFRIAPTNRVLKLRGFEGAHIGIFNNSSILHCLDIIEYEGVIENELGLSKCAAIITIKITRLKYDLNISKTNALSVKSVLYMINNEAATSTITITLHKTVYDRCVANADILAALQTHTNVSLASA